MKMQNYYLILAFLTLFSVGDDALAGRVVNGTMDAPASTCKLKVPPVGARVLYSHGVNLSTFPSEIGEKFTGCQHTWLEDGELLASFKYRDGQLLRAVLFEPGQKKLTCVYDKGNLKSGSKDRCKRLLTLAKP